MTVLSIRACAALARRHVDAEPAGIPRAELLDRLQLDGADPQRADRGLALAIERRWLTLDPDAGGQTIVRRASLERDADPEQPTNSAQRDSALTAAELGPITPPRVTTPRAETTRPAPVARCPGCGSRRVVSYHCCTDAEAA